MYSMRSTIIALLSAIPLLVAASPVDVSLAPRAALANLAVVNLYSGGTCGGSDESFTVTAGYVCHRVSSARASIQVAESGCSTNTWSGTDCLGSSQHITGDKCFSVLFGSVSVQC
ncbi:hypothetical protein F5Y03DRAFT_154499 [Xylaria venustula]|nr:hypothetical protein F5Y03DRAFT_154499 [Xylaria venustula]